MNTKKIITMVGTSIFENYLEDNKDDNNFRNYVEPLKEKRANQYNDNLGRISQIKEKITQWINKKEKASAEIKSLLKLKEELKEDFEIYFLSSDTILSKLAGEILKDKLPSFGFSKVYLYEIKGLQIWDRKEFNQGMVNMINKIYQIAKEYWNNIVINITGGFKATIPYLTILAQVNRCPIYYIFENTDALIKISYIPLAIKWEVFERNEGFFAKLEREEICEVPAGVELRDDVESLLEKADNLISLNSLGIVLREQYKLQFDIFSVHELAEKYIKGTTNWKTIAEKSFKELKKRLQNCPEHADLRHSLQNVELPSGFYCFKHKEDNLQVRILYKNEERKTRYGSRELDIYIGLIRIGNDVHNVESEYVNDFKTYSNKIISLEDYKKTYKIKKEV